MTEYAVSLTQFVKAFNLRNSLGVIRFKANVVAKINNTINTKFCEVHIITSNNLGAVYFLNEQTNDDVLPDMVDLKFAVCRYIDGKCFLIEITSYTTISIFPVITNDKTI